MIALLKFAIFLFFFVPPLFFIPGRFGTHWILTTYREPKLAACQILGWITISIFWAAFAFSKKWTEDFNKKLKSAIRYKWLWLLFVFFMYICWTSTRAVVIEASYYEIFQYITILNLVFIFIVLFQESSYIKPAFLGLLLSFAIVTLIGIYQMKQPISFLIPISSRHYYSSTFGYKNPTALALIGQLFLGGGCLAWAIRSGKRILACLLVLTLVAELVYIGTLGSRTSYLSLSVSVIFFVALSVLILAKAKRKKVALWVLIIASVSMGVFALVAVKHPLARNRVKMMLPYLKSPSKFLKSDRGTYLLNSIYMAEKNPWGVGIGNWGYAYAEYRKYRPKFLFNSKVQARRAHGDYAQLLGETGWPGLSIWAALICWTFLVGFRTATKRSSIEDGLFLTQFVAFCVVMATDYCIEMPYHKFAFFAVGAIIHARSMAPFDLAAAGKVKAPRRPAGRRKSSRKRRRS